MLSRVEEVREILRSELGCQGSLPDVLDEFKSELDLLNVSRRVVVTLWHVSVPRTSRRTIAIKVGRRV